MARALAGVRVVEFGGFAAGPVIGKHLANYGADVIRIESHLAEWTASLARDEVVRRLRIEGLRVYPVNSMADLFEDPQLAARGFWRTVEHPLMGSLRVESPPALLRETPPMQDHAAPLMGAHTTEVLGDILGLSLEQIDALRADGALD